MLISCEKCRTTFMLADELIPHAGAPVQCTRCRHVFNARRPDAPAAPREPRSLFVNCEKCTTVFSLDEALVPEGGATVQCSRCGHSFWLPRDPPRDAIMFGGPPQSPPAVEESYRSERGRVTFGAPQAAPPRDQNARTMTFGARLPEPGSPLVENSRADRRLFTANPFDERLQAAAPAPRPEKPLLDSLYARVFATPDDDAPRMVLADHLSELGDPRGEFIAIQLAEPDGPTGLAKGRIKELKRHFDAWLPAGVERSTAVFRRGFLHACRWIAPTDASHREWRTVEELECSGARGAADFYRGRLFASDALPRLRTLRRAEATAFAALASGPVRERLAMLHTFHLPFDELRGRSGALAHHFPELHTLDLEGTALPTDGLAFLCEVLELRATKRVRSAVQRLRLDDPDARLRLREAPELVRAAPGLAVSVYTDVERLCCVEFSGGRVRLCHRGSVSTHLLEQLVARAQREGLPSTLTRVEEIS